MKFAEVVSVGTELLMGQIVDTHAATMGRLLADCGIACRHRATVGDNRERVIETLRVALSRADIVIVIGGLGPTMDDLTRESIAEALDDTLVRDEAYVQELRAWFIGRGFTFAESNAKQGDRPTCGVFIPNPYGTAPGLHCQRNGKTVIAMPGPKGEFDPMAEGPVRQILESLSDGVLVSRVLRVVGIGESAVEQMVAHVMRRDNPTLAPYAHLGEVHLRLTARADTRSAAEALIEPTVAELRDILGAAVVGYAGESLEMSIVQRLRDLGRTVACAESMTGGQLGARLSAEPGSSAVFRGGFIVYTVEAKRAMLGIDPNRLARYGPVSAEIGADLALRAREILGSDYALSVTGNAGPTSDVDGKPVGRVYLGLAGPTGVQVREENYRGVREDIQRRATQTLLTWLRSELESADS